MYALMCYVKEYEKLHATCDVYVSSGDMIPLQNGLKAHALKYICNTLNFVEI